MSISTNPHLSAVHAANFERSIAKAQDLETLKREAAKHGPWLLGNDKTRLREIYTARLLALGGSHGSK